VLVPNADGYLRGGMPVTGDITLPAVSGIELPVTAFIDDTHTSVYVVAGGVVKTTAVREVKDDGTNAIVTGVQAGDRVIGNVDTANVGNGDHADVNPSPRPSPTST
jgi:hypothetical protein